MSLTVEAPAGSHWDWDEVKTAQGKESLGDVPLLVWDTLEGAVAHYTEAGVLATFDGTSLRVSYQGIARRMKVAGKSDDEIAKAIVDFKPGTRQTGVSTPASRARKAAASAVEAGVDGDVLAQLLAKIASGEISPASLGITTG